ncbi:MAG: DUF748 domain-containing protein [Halioglobus sp.]|nr:DUF748 domain-containing protein [Halioglobus sp.]
MDESLPIDFRTVIGELSGQVAGISSEPGAAARVDISGSVNGTAPVKLLGTASPFADPLALDLDLTFKNVDMALLTPYAATYAGYKIQSGLLDLNLEYELAENKLAGQNKIRLQQFKLGEKVQSDKAIDAPLNLAIAIMTDSNGVIEMSVPVSGSPADPSFSLGSVIGKALAGAITSVVTAPFKVLGGLVGSDEDLQHLPFPAGSAEPDATTRKRMAVLAQVLDKRPKIVLSLNGRVNPQADRESMQLDRLRQQLLDAGLTQEDLDRKDTAWQDAIDKRFRQLETDVEEPESLTVRDKQQRIAETIAIGDEQLVELAQARARSVKSHLVNNEGTAADRAVIAATDLEDDEHRFSGVELTLR